VTWAASIPRSAAAGLGPLRFLAGAEACFADELIWLRGNELSDADELRVRQLPGAERFQVNEAQELIPPGALLPVGKLPAGDWQKLISFIVPELPPPRIVAGSLPRLSLTLVRDAEQRDVAALLTSFERWREYALQAPQVRLSPLQFAASSAGNVLIVGTPLPPISGTFFTEASGIYVAAGWHWSPAVSAAVVRRALQLQPDDLALWHATGHWELICRTDFVAARRAAVRATGEALEHVSR
jgi:hypothetical protein